jgi:hypothetical protein
MRSITVSWFLISLLCSGCVSYSSKPEISDHTNLKVESSIKTFTLEHQSQRNTGWLEKSLHEVTAKAIPSAQEMSSQAKSENKPDLTIKTFEFFTSEACAQDYLTGLSLGLIPSWCTRPILKVQFTLNHRDTPCQTNEYLISSTSISHITLIPFTAFNPSNQTIELYQATLKNFINYGKCTIP